MKKKTKKSIKICHLITWKTIFKSVIVIKYAYRYLKVRLQHTNLLEIIKVMSK